MAPSKLLLIAFLFILSPLSIAEEPSFYKVLRVVDGDTFVLEEIGRVRMIGVDTPETKDPRKPVQYFGKEASNFTKNLIEGKRVRLETEKGKSDFFKRTLAYVFLEDGTFVNRKIIEEGYGHAYTKYPFGRMEEFRQAERSARENKKGLWADREPTNEEVPSTKARAKALQMPRGLLKARPNCVSKKCSEIKSCDEAKYLLNTCGFKHLDKDKNGIPCETLCK